ncbi:nucleotidyltransferase domain-containing protein [Staphylococcus cohnii]|uniref:nucleotidyltransferase domain-containing protein n=1 Tax=Staphylococcus cohnii TaxID=29382 RepID=UPI0036969561
MEKVTKAILEELKDYIIVVGSVAEGTATESSDIDFYVKSKSEEELDREIEMNNYSMDGIEETYIDKVIGVLIKYKVDWVSEFVAYITTYGLPVQLEFSPFFDITDKKKSKVNIYGISFDSYTN